MNNDQGQSVVCPHCGGIGSGERCPDRPAEPATGAPPAATTNSTPTEARAPAAQTEASGAAQPARELEHPVIVTGGHVPGKGAGSLEKRVTVTKSIKIGDSILEGGSEPVAVNTSKSTSALRAENQLYATIVSGLPNDIKKRFTKAFRGRTPVNVASPYVTLRDHKRMMARALPTNAEAQPELVGPEITDEREPKSTSAHNSLVADLMKRSHEAVAKGYAILLEDSAHTDVEIEKMCAEIIGQEFVDGDSYCVPGPIACVEETIRHLKAKIGKLKDLVYAAYLEGGMNAEITWLFEDSAVKKQLSAILGQDPTGTAATSQAQQPKSCAEAQAPE